MYRDQQGSEPLRCNFFVKHLYETQQSDTGVEPDFRRHGVPDCKCYIKIRVRIILTQSWICLGHE